MKIKKKNDELSEEFGRLTLVIRRATAADPQRRYASGEVFSSVGIYYMKIQEIEVENSTNNALRNAVALDGTRIVYFGPKARVFHKHKAVLLVEGEAE